MNSKKDTRKIKEPIGTKELQAINEKIEHYLREQDTSGSAASALSLVRGRLSASVKKPEAMIVLGAVLCIIGSTMAMEDASKASGLLALCKSILGKI